MEKLVRILKKVKIRNIVILILLVMFNSYAWFVYATRVSMDLSVHISSWNIEFAVGEEETTTNIVVSVERAYPGMETFVKEITVKNKGEIKAELSYRIISLRVLDEVFVVDENMTSEEIENKINTEYPFKINITKDDSLLLEGTGEGLFTITVEWPFESGDDAKDTLWGNKAYEYYKTHPNKKCIELEMELAADQINETN